MCFARHKVINFHTRREDGMIFSPNGPITDLLILSVIARGDAYGYQISQILKKVSNTKDSALYPILKRLQENGYVTTYDQPFLGRNRKYYTMTPQGRSQWEMLKKAWASFKIDVDEIVERGEWDEQS